MGDRLFSALRKFSIASNTDRCLLCSLIIRNTIAHGIPIIILRRILIPAITAATAISIPTPTKRWNAIPEGLSGTQVTAFRAPTSHFSFPHGSQRTAWNQDSSNPYIIASWISKRLTFCAPFS
nr:hypothetical protein Iba_chr11aCG4840 [Ipomoea batatas]